MPENTPQTVLVTGASSGIGRAITEKLSARGSLVFAGARKASDLDDLKRLSNVIPLQLDVSTSEDVAGAAAAVKASGGGLYGLVNNAGIGTIGPLAEIPLEELHRVLGVNLDGPHRMVGAMYPFLRESRGRIVNISSIAGFLIEPFLGPYNISKHAIEAYSDILREEVAPLGIQVSTIEPGNFRSQIFAKSMAAIPAEWRAEWENPHSAYRQQMLELVNYLTAPDVLDRSTHPAPIPVAEAVVHALFSEDPKPRYVVGTSAEGDHVIDRILAVLRQVNEGQAYPRSAAELAARLEKALE